MMINPLQLLSSNRKGLALECQCKIAKTEKKNLFPVQENASFSLSVSFLKSECRISMCQLVPKLWQEWLRRTYHRTANWLLSEAQSCKPNLAAGLHAEILSQVISVNVFVLKKPYWLTPQRQPDPVLSTTL